MLLSLLSTNTLDFPVCCCGYGLFPSLLSLHFKAKGIYSFTSLFCVSRNLFCLRCLSPSSVASQSDQLLLHFSVEENAVFSTCSSVLPKEIRKSLHFFFLFILFLNSIFIDEKLPNRRLKVKNRQSQNYISMQKYANLQSEKGPLRERQELLSFLQYLLPVWYHAKLSKHVIY